ncbi:uncharacterized protein [Drosophila pseudoobscura]|uniref:Uncharacterized protein n=1 Tax=Drosophila pseudoobscura pseudoobscura TaxID=46245 RepID=A0A6I8UUL4_DROPS|nr:uncharacterized protein LOC4804602 [Drosophila pseudoobscura]
MVMRSRGHINVRVPVMVMIVVILQQVSASYGRNVENGASGIWQKRRPAQDEWHDPSPLDFKKPVVDPELLFQQLEEFDQFGDPKVLDKGYIWGPKPNSAQQLQKEQKKNKLKDWLNRFHQNEVLDGARGNQEIDDLITGPVMKNFNEKTDKSSQQLEQRHRQMEAFQNAAADLAFDRMINIQKEQGKGAKTVFLPLYPSAKPSLARPSLVKIAPAKPLNGKIHLASKAKCQKPLPSSPVTPRPSTCPATTFRPPTTRHTKMSSPKPLAPPSRPKCKHRKGKKKSKKLGTSSANSLEKRILALKQHALSILKNLNFLEMELLSQSPDICPRHQSHQGPIPKKKTKTGERLDRPTQPSLTQSKLHRGFFFGIRPASTKERLADLAASREEELRLQVKVWREHLQHLMARKRPFPKAKRFEAAPAAAARLEPVADTQLNLNSQPTPSSAAQSDYSPTVRMPEASDKKFADQNYELNSNNRNLARRKKKKRKKKRKMVALLADDTPMRS